MDIIRTGSVRTLHHVGLHADLRVVTSHLWDIMPFIIQFSLLPHHIAWYIFSSPSNPPLQNGLIASHDQVDNHLPTQHRQASFKCREHFKVLLQRGPSNPSPDAFFFIFLPGSLTPRISPSCSPQSFVYTFLLQRTTHSSTHQHPSPPCSPSPSTKQQTRPQPQAMPRPRSKSPTSRPPACVARTGASGSTCLC